MNLSVNSLLIITTCIITIVAWRNPRMYTRFLFNAYQVERQKQFDRFVTSGFIHANWFHLIFNMITLFFFGQMVELAYRSVVGNSGSLIFLLMYLSAIIISEIPSFFKHRTNGYYNSLGASGGVSAVVFAYILFFPTNMLYLMGVIPVPGFLLGILYILYSYFQGKRMGDNINHQAHLVGALYGLGFTVLLHPSGVPAFFQKIADFSLY